MVGHSTHSTRKPGSYEHEHDHTGIEHDGHGPHPNAHMGSKSHVASKHGEKE